MSARPNVPLGVGPECLLARFRGNTRVSRNLLHRTRIDADKDSVYAVGNPVLLVALPSLRSRLLLDATYIDLSDECFCDDVEGVDLLLH